MIVIYRYDQDWIIALDHSLALVKCYPCKGRWLIGIAPDPGTRKGSWVLKPSGVHVKVVLVFSANELDLGVPDACEVGSAVVLPKKKETC
jgi:hypothetical protein